jgi:outer membrane protein W
MKNIIFVFVVCFLSHQIASQSEIIRPNRINIGYGVGNLSKTIFKLSNKGKYDINYKGEGPFFGKYEHTINPFIGVGLNISYIAATIDYDFKETYTTDSVTLLSANMNYKSVSYLLRFNFHPLKENRIDPYLGFGIGYRDSKLSISTNDPLTKNHDLGIRLPFKFGFEATIGSNFMFSNNIGAYIEIGLSKAVLQFGFTAKF